MRTLKLTAPSHWASYLIDLDQSGLDDTGLAAVDNWLAVNRLKVSDCVGCEDAGFVWSHAARRFAPAADCQTYTFLV
jgi:hypothetical protein